MMRFLPRDVFEVPSQKVRFKNVFFPTILKVQILDREIGSTFNSVTKVKIYGTREISLLLNLVVWKCDSSINHISVYLTLREKQRGTERPISWPRLFWKELYINRHHSQKNALSGKLLGLVLRKIAHFREKLLEQSMLDPFGLATCNHSQFQL